MAYINSSGGISSGGPSTRTGSTNNSTANNDPTSQFDVGYSGNAVVAEDGSLVATPGEQITQVGNEVNAGPGQITGAAEIDETKEAVEELGGDPSSVQPLVPNPNADSSGTVLDLQSVVEESIQEQSLAESIGSVTRDRESPLAESDEPDSDSNPTATVVGDGDGGSDYTITGGVDEDVSNADNTGPQTVPGVTPSAGGSSVLDIVGVGGIVALIGVVGYLMSQE